MTYSVVPKNELYHHGIMGMKWGVRRFQNSDGTLTERGKKRYAKVAESERLTKKETKRAESLLKKVDKYSENSVLRDVAAKKLSAIKSGDMKAGRDFIVQRDYNTWPLANLIPFAHLVAPGLAMSISNASRDKKYTSDKPITNESIAWAPSILTVSSSKTDTLVEKKR